MDDLLRVDFVVYLSVLSRHLLTSDQVVSEMLASLFFLNLCSLEGIGLNPKDVSSKSL